MFKLTNLVERVLNSARDEAKSIKSLLVYDDQVLFQLYREVQYQIVGKTLSNNGFNIFTLRYYIDNRENILHKQEYETDEEFNESFDVCLSDETIDTLELAENFAVLAEKQEVDTVCLILALLESENPVFKNYVSDYEVDIENARRELIELLCTGSIASMDSKKDTDDNDDGYYGSKKKSHKPDKIIEELCIDLTQMALNGQIDPIIGREREIDAIINTMARRSKNNVLLYGDPGVGKSAVVKGLALKLAKGEVPSLMNKHIYSLSVGSLLSGTTYRGQLATKLTEFIKAIDKLGNAIIFIDEMHLILKKEGSKESNEDIPGILKQELASRKIQLIGCTTTKELRIIQEDPAFTRRLNLIKLEEPNEEDAVEIMKGLNYKYEEFHNMIIPEDTLKTSVKLAKRYLTEKRLPDSAIDLIDSAAAKLKLKVTADYVPLTKKLEVEIDNIKTQINDEFNIAKCIELYKLLDTKEQELKAAKKGEIEDKPPSPTLLEEHITEEVELRTGIPTSKMLASEVDKLLHFEEEMHKHIIGQEIAIKEIADAIRRSSVGINDPNKPIASFLFAGSTGVGKSEAAKALADIQFNSRDNIIRIDCSEYKESYSMSKLIGSAPGYVGHSDGGQLTEAIRHKPYSVVLIDELEKAHPSFSDILLQILDEGRLTDSHGVTVSFKNCIIIITTNIGSGLFTQSKPVGFGAGSQEDNELNEYEQLKERTLGAIKKTLRPEVINRLSKVVVFHALNKEQQRDIVRLLGKKLDARLLEQGIVAKCSDNALDFITDKGYDSEYGARPLARAIIEYIEQPLSLLMLEGKVKSGDNVYIDLDEKNEKLSFTVVKEAFAK